MKEIVSDVIKFIEKGSAQNKVSGQSQNVKNQIKKIEFALKQTL
jgi:hypothetical protein